MEVLRRGRSINNLRDSKYKVAPGRVLFALHLLVCHVRLSSLRGAIDDKVFFLRPVVGAWGGIPEGEAGNPTLFSSPCPLVS